MFAAAGGSTDVLLQYGVLGVLAAILLPFAFAAYRRERDRGDRLETELREQNKLIQEKLVVVLGEATRAIAQVLDRRDPR